MPTGTIQKIIVFSISNKIYKNKKGRSGKTKKNKTSFFTFQDPNTINPVMLVYIKKIRIFFAYKYKIKKEIRIVDACMSFHPNLYFRDNKA